MVGGAALATAALIRPREARAAKSLTVVLESEVTILDPHVITATITRTFGLHAVSYTHLTLPTILRV